MSRLALVFILAGCVLNRLAGPDNYTVAGVVTRVEHDQRYEAPCGIEARWYRACDEVPICCAYRVTITDSSGHRNYAWAFWPRSAPGIAAGRRVWASLIRMEVWELSRCQAVAAATSRACPSEIAYVIPDDQHWGYTDGQN
jgi:hypothetical protein